jgi:hypothetical protein
VMSNNMSCVLGKPAFRDVSDSRINGSDKAVKGLNMKRLRHLCGAGRLAPCTGILHRRIRSRITQQCPDL